ncbi:hypothetical protein ABE599_13140 [Achromobacter mucicolens]|uniref:hypothetical protein n=1 Tax=Achromobacter mucicolens TaxID=1389922 RepID=UPI0032090855
MLSVSKSARLAGVALCWMVMTAGAAMAQERAAPVQPDLPRPSPSPTDATTLGQQLLNAGPDPRVELDGRSRDHAAIFGSDDPDERALLDQERALQAQRDQLKVLERVLNAPPPGADSHPPAMIPLTSGRPMNVPQLLPAPSGSQLDQQRSETRRSVDDMQRRVDGLRREADALRQGGK